MVLIGESLGDPDMLKGLPDTDNVIKIGFLNHNVRSHLRVVSLGCLKCSKISRGEGEGGRVGGVGGWVGDCTRF